MRFDYRLDSVAFIRDPERALELIRAENLVYARFETQLGHKLGGTLDLVFATATQVVLVPWIVIDPLMLLEAETSAFVWPSLFKSADPSVIDDVEARIDPWLRTKVIARFENGSGERFFTDDAAIVELIATAKRKQWLCTAPAASILRDIAPHVYASRFVNEGRVRVAGPGAANGGAFLHGIMPDVSITIEDEAEAEAARRWFGIDCVTTSRCDTADVYVGPREGDPGAPYAALIGAEPVGVDEHRVALAKPLPIEILVSFDLDDAPEELAFTVRAVERPGRVSHVSVPGPTGGSGGRIALVGREDIVRNRDADSDAIEALAAMLNAEGFSAEIVTPSHLVASRYDLIHVFGCRFAKAIESQISAARKAEIPIAITPYADDPGGEAVKGFSSLPKLLQSSDDEGLRFDYLEALARRRLSVDQTAGDDVKSIRTLCESAGVAFVTCEREEHHLRSAFGFSGRSIVLPALAINTNSRAATTWATGARDFVLLMGAVTRNSNAYMVTRACAALELPLVLCGHVVDASYYNEIRFVLGRRGTWLPASQLDDESSRALLARARVVADCALPGRGLHRLASAACAGTPIVASTTGYAGDVWRDLVCLADPLSQDSIADALARAWAMDDDARNRLTAATAPFADPLSFLVSTVAGYQEAAKAKAAL